jgi:hypothetical protein
LGVHVPDKRVWSKVRQGDINGFSMYGSGRREPVDIEFDIPDDGVVKGETFGTDHTHEYKITFDKNGVFMGGETNEVNGHSHLIVKGTATERAGLDKHNHRFSFVEALYKSAVVR